MEEFYNQGGLAISLDKNEVPLLQVVAHAYSSSIWEVVQGYPWLHTKFKVSLGYMRAYLPLPPQPLAKKDDGTDDFSSFFLRSLRAKSREAPSVIAFGPLAN